MDRENKEDFKKGVVDYIDKCFQTAIIGSIAEIEHIIDKDKLKDVRKRILDKGNDQRRNVIKLLNKIGVFEHQYSYVFDVKPAKLERNSEKRGS